MYHTLIDHLFLISLKKKKHTLESIFIRSEVDTHTRQCTEIILTVTAGIFFVVFVSFCFFREFQSASGKLASLSLACLAPYFERKRLAVLARCTRVSASCIHSRKNNPVLIDILPSFDWKLSLCLHESN